MVGLGGIGGADRCVRRTSSEVLDVSDDGGRVVRRWVWGFEEGLKLHTCSGGNCMVEIEVVLMLKLGF